MPLAVDEEEVTAEPVSSRTGLNRGQVDSAHRELGEDLHQRTRVVVDQEGGERGAVRTGRRRQFARRRHHDEPGHRVGPVVYGGRHDAQPVLGGGEVAGQRRVQIALGDLPGGFGVGGERHPLISGQVGREPAAALRLGLGVTADRLDVCQRGAWPGE
jgi:hypothetical protein